MLRQTGTLAGSAVWCRPPSAHYFRQFISKIYFRGCRRRVQKQEV